MGDPRHVLFGSSSPEPDSSTCISPERARQISALLFAAKALANRTMATGFDPDKTHYCSICKMVWVDGVVPHSPTCEAARVEAIIAELCALPSQPIPIRKEDAQAPEPSRAEAGTSPRVDLGEATTDAQERVLACLRFCEGIPTEALQRELPLASADRRRWHEIMHLRKALPFLPAVTL